MPKNITENKISPEIEFHFPIEGETIKAKNLEEAQKELVRRKSKSSVDEEGI